MDLRSRFPRSVRETVGGHVHLGRMIDKCRAVLAGMQGDYVYPCPMDERLLQFAGISSEDFCCAVQGRTDEELMEWFRLNATPHSQSEIDAWNETFLAVEPDTEDKRAYFKHMRDAIDPRRTDITTWADLLDLDEQRPVPTRHTSASTGGRG
jgi:hypothetical protein